MNPEHDKEFEHNLNQLVRIIKKLIKNLPPQANPPQIPYASKDAEGNVQLNLYFAFFPMSPEDMEELEELYDEFYPRDEKSDNLKFKLSSEDMEFLRRHGLRF